MFASIRRVAAVTAIAAPMMIGAGTPAMASSAAARGAAPIVVNITYAPVINGGGSADEFEKSAEKHARELFRIIERELDRKRRTEF